MNTTSSTVMFIWDSATTPSASFTTQVLHTGCGADRWNKFVSGLSRAGELTGFNRSSDATIVAMWWRAHSRVWASRTATTASGGNPVEATDKGRV